MIENEAANHEDELADLDDVLDHAFFSDQEYPMDMEDEWVFMQDTTNDFRHLDEL